MNNITMSDKPEIKSYQYVRKYVNKDGTVKESKYIIRRVKPSRDNVRIGDEEREMIKSDLRAIIDQNSNGRLPGGKLHEMLKIKYPNLKRWLVYRLLQEV